MVHGDEMRGIGMVRREGSNRKIYRFKMYWFEARGKGLLSRWVRGRPSVCGTTEKEMAAKTKTSKCLKGEKPKIRCAEGSSNKRWRMV